MAAGCPRDHRPKFGNLFVNTALLRLETFDGGGDDIRSQRVRHSISTLHLQRNLFLAHA